MKAPFFLGGFAFLILAGTASANGFGTQVHGPLHFKEINGTVLSDGVAPLEVDTLKQIMVAEGHDYRSTEDEDEGEALWSLPVRVKEGSDETTALVFEYSVQVGNMYQVPFDLLLRLNHNGYYLNERIPMQQHAGIFKRPLYIERRQRNTGERLEVVLAFLDLDTPTSSDIRTALEVQEGLMADEADPEVFQQMVALIDKLMRDVGYIDATTARMVMGLEDRTRFRQIPVAAQFRTLAGLAYWFARAPELDQAIPPNLTYFDLAQYFFNRAVWLAHDHPDEIPARDLANTYQNFYRLECDAGEAEDCFYAFLDFFDLQKSFRQSVYRGFFLDFATELEEISGLGVAGDATDDRFHRRVAKDDALVEYWGLFIEAAGSSDRASARVERDRRLKKVLWRAEEIVRYSMQAED
ncbi:hypothetical protein [Thalassococcus sp. S3]|uniref:hypothetical protein n=1 Tax=Thalassococcus sp. S3 TaxID=2017482 RepID=UPI0010247A0F|nr:hypothetical protein [Thalassococcus sp. S3]QBF32204.1 hypothetical protein CFI11_13390 [Thalassococcus sp. S3]